MRFVQFVAAVACALGMSFGAWAQGDNGDGTFSNPELWADVPDPDVIRVGRDFYMVSTTMHLMPGAPVMHSRDLVNWRTVGYVFDRLDDKPAYDLLGATVYGRGQWATSMRYHDGMYYAYFSPNDAPFRGYVYKAKDPAGEWTLVSRIPHFHDASLLFDDDGRVYMFYGAGQVRELRPDLTDVMPGGLDARVFERGSDETGLLEGSRVIKHDGKYYVLMISWPAGGIRRQVCYRADRITGPYEKRVVLEDRFGPYGGVGQGTIVDDGRGNWYGIIFQDRGGVGRVPMLMPCRWVDGWPMLGDGQGHVPEVMEKPVAGCAPRGVVVSDDFGGKRLKMEWQWNHNPVDSCWSLRERRGWLRLTAGRVVESIFEAPNTLTQRMEGPRCRGVVAMDLAGMEDGDVAGFAAFNGDTGMLAVECRGGRKYLSMRSESVSLADDTKRVTGVEREVPEEVELTSDMVYLRIDADFRPGRDMASFMYSYDNSTWTKIGRDYRMIFDYRRFFMGSKFAIFNYATCRTGGHVDVDFFDYERLRD